MYCELAQPGLTERRSKPSKVPIPEAAMRKSVIVGTVALVTVAVSGVVVQQAQASPTPAKHSSSPTAGPRRSPSSSTR